MTPGGDFEYISISWYGLFTQTTEMKRLRSGFLLKEIFDRFTNKTLSTLSPDRNLWLYFAHDITISNMLNSLGLYKVNYLGMRGSSDLIYFKFSFSYMYLRMRRVFFSNYTNHQMEFHMYKYSIECHLK